MKFKKLHWALHGVQLLGFFSMIGFFLYGWKSSLCPPGNGPCMRSVESAISRTLVWLPGATDDRATYHNLSDAEEFNHMEPGVVYLAVWHVEQSARKWWRTPPPFPPHRSQTPYPSMGDGEEEEGGKMTTTAPDRRMKYTAGNSWPLDVNVYKADNKWPIR